MENYMKPDNSTLESAIKSRIVILNSFAIYVYSFEIKSEHCGVPTVTFTCQKGSREINVDDLMKSIGACWCGDTLENNFSVCCELIVKDKTSMLFVAALN